jgi:hypothetical protein
MLAFDIYFSLPNMSVKRTLYAFTTFSYVSKNNFKDSVNIMV